MDLSFLHITWWTLLIGVVVNFIAGMLWYGPIFGKVWMGLVGLSEKDIQEGGNKLVYLGSLIMALITTYTLNILFNLIDPATIPAAIAVGLLIWFGFILLPTINHYAYESRPAKLLLINCFYDFIPITIMSIVLQLAR